ncbi:AMP-dependent synthetase [Rhodovibrio sodomensis]|uniref:AMP-dependent synthetase n=1 Tax=Rhodovibrio sodomensis TaxID=1088 RepID=A0ABS1DCS0_9PROT|nr:acyl--CoA ligase [Rhodovibrio sodomensis]MBK1667684.1 AMP-dependent synthetase [Rhodovibrio sodomensis]
MAEGQTTGAARSLSGILNAGAGAATAIAAPERAPMSHAKLRELAGHTVSALNALGIGRGDRVALVLPNSPETLAAFLAIGAGAATAPLNPAYRHDEYAYYLADLNAKALVVRQDGGEEAALARAAAEGHGIPVLELAPDYDGPAGSFCLTGGSEAEAAHPGFAEADDEALVLHTSGTTSKPKIVPLLHRNVAASAANIRNVLQLGAGDICLSIMPLFHIHGLIAASLAPLAAGGQVYVPGPFNALAMLRWLQESGATWYTGVPTMHQALLDRALKRPEAAQGLGLRFIRSSSASLPTQTMRQLEDTFGCPVIESYGMTEAAHQMTSNPLPPAPRKPGSVGVAAGPDVAIADDAGNFLPQGAAGEVCIKGDNVTPGYENNPDANAKAFFQGWFRTGDQGILDDEGYLTITGRLKELINRGGEKVSPVEVDEALMDHPEVAQAVAFALPHRKLGETVAAAVRLAEGAALDEKTLKGFVAERLADFKVPQKIVFLDEIPKGPTGKMQRIGMAEKLGLVEPEGGKP